MKQRVVGLLGIALTSWLSFAYVPSDAPRCEAEETLAAADAVDLAEPHETYLNGLYR